MLTPIGDPRITGVTGREVWDSRGRPTVEVAVRLANGIERRAIAPAGVSTGSGEALDRRDGGSRLGGFGVEAAVAAVNGPIQEALSGRDAGNMAAIDAALVACDGTADKSRLGGNALVATSMAVAHAAASAAGVPLWRHLAGYRDVVLPLPEIQIFGGGAHAARRTEIQDYMVAAIAARDFARALEMTAEVYRAAGEIMADRGRLYGVADEGGYWPAFDSNEAALETLVRAIERAGFVPGQDLAICLDIAASGFYRQQRYRFGLEGRELDSSGMAELLIDWLHRFPIVSLEDPFDESDADGFASFTKAVGDRVQIVGDDLLVTNAGRVADAAKAGACNALLVKPNQAGTLSEAKAAFDAARQAGWQNIVSARSGETEDVTVTHLAVGWGAEQLKVGSIARSERLAKWNEGLRIAESLGENATLATPFDRYRG